jgi:RNA polymerase sigma-70 factor (ECF subfamily)
MAVAEDLTGLHPEEAPGSVARATAPLPPFSVLFANTRDHIAQRARRLRVPDYAVDDVVQETFIIAHRRLPEFSGASTLRHWLSCILKNVVRNFFRTQRRRGRGDALWSQVIDPSQLVDAAPAPDELASHHQSAVIIRRLVARLDPDKAIVFTRAELEGLTIEEIAGETNAKLQTVYSRLKAARRFFRRALRQRALGVGARRPFLLRS